MQPNISPSSAAPRLTVDSPYEVARWRPFVQWVLYIPHGIVVYVLRAVSSVVAVLYWLIVLFTGRPNKSLFGFAAMVLRYETRASLYLIGFSEQFPPFEFTQGGADDGGYSPVRLDLPEPPEEVSRKAALNFIFAIPHYVVFMVYAVAAAVLMVIAWFAVIFTGQWPDSMRDFLVKVGNYYARVWSYVFMTVDEYPSFSLD